MIGFTWEFLWCYYCSLVLLIFFITEKRYKTYLIKFILSIFFYKNGRLHEKKWYLAINKCHNRINTSRYFFNLNKINTWWNCKFILVSVLIHLLRILQTSILLKVEIELLQSSIIDPKYECWDWVSLTPWRH